MSSANVLRVGLTGGIGSGKTTVARIFELLEVPVYYADEASKRLYHTNDALKQAIIRHFGEEIYEGGELVRSRLAEKVFASPDQLAFLNQLVHPLTQRDAAEWMQQQKAPYVIKEAALLFEAGSAADLDFIIGVYAPQHLRIKRAMDRDGSTREQVLNRLNRQIDEKIKMKLCDYVITNDEQQLLIPQVVQMHQQLMLMAGAESS